MKKNSASLFVAVALGLLFSAASALAAGHDHEMKIGKKAEKTFSQDTMVGNVTLKAGDYIVQHKVVGEDHFVSFTKVSEGIFGHSGGSREGLPILIKCRIEPLNEKASQTAFYFHPSGGTTSLTRIEVGGENVAHLFDASDDAVGME
jgi:hypothetical protein